MEERIRTVRNGPRPYRHGGPGALRLGTPDVVGATPSVPCLRRRPSGQKLRAGHPPAAGSGVRVRSVGSVRSRRVGTGLGWQTRRARTGGEGGA